MTLKIKAFIYKYTGIYLARKEEQAYTRSPEFWKKFTKLEKKKLPAKDRYLILVGIWQAKHGFSR